MYNRKLCSELLYIVTDFPNVQVVIAIMVTILWIGPILALLLNSGKQEGGDLTGCFLSSCDRGFLKSLANGRDWFSFILLPGSKSLFETETNREEAEDKDLEKNLCELLDQAMPETPETIFRFFIYMSQ